MLLQASLLKIQNAIFFLESMINKNAKFFSVQITAT